MWGITGDESSRHECHLGNTRGRSCDPGLLLETPGTSFVTPDLKGGKISEWNTAAARPYGRGWNSLSLFSVNLY